MPLRCNVFDAARVVAAATIVLAIGVGPSRADSQTFVNPKHNGHRVDYCAKWAQGCGEEAATQFCKLNGFDKAGAWTVAEDIGTATPTLVIGDNKVCGDASCDGFASITCVKASSSLRSTGRALQSRPRVALPTKQDQASSLKKLLNLTLPPMPGPATTIEVGAHPYNPNAQIYLSNVDLDADGIALHRQKGPVVQVHFKAAANTHYAVECATLPMKYPTSLGYKLQWSSSLPNEGVSQAENLIHDPQNVQWIYAAIPKRSSERYIKVVASDFMSSRHLFLCRLTPFT